MKEGLLQLLELQDVDRELKALEDAGSQYPAEIEVRQRELARAEEELKAGVEQVESLEREQRRLEGELEVSKNSLKEHEARFAEVTNNREYDALQLEIEACKTTISQCETRILELIEQAERAREENAADHQELEQVRQDQQGHIDELQQKLDSLRSEVDGVQARRRTVIDNIEDNLVHLYERCRKKPGVKIAPVRKGSCGTCYTLLPAQQRNMVKRNDEMQTCHSCAAILVWDDQST